MGTPLTAVAGSLISPHSSGNYRASSSGCQCSRPPTPYQHLQGQRRRGSVPQAGVQMEPRPRLQRRGGGWRWGAGWGRLKGDRQGEKEAGGNRRDRAGGLGGAGNGRQRQMLDHHSNPRGETQKQRLRQRGKGEEKGEEHKGRDKKQKATDEKWPKEQDE